VVCNSIDTDENFLSRSCENTFERKLFSMSPNKISPSSGTGKAKRTSSRNLKKSINPDKLVSDINQQTEALNKIIKKFGEPRTDSGQPGILKSRNKSKNK